MVASLLKNNWNVHIPTKSALQISLSPLDLESTAQSAVEKMLGSDKMKLHSENLHFLDGDDVQRGTTYDIILFCGLPSNFDEARVSRSPWAADELAHVMKRLKGVPSVIVSSLWGGIKNDGVVPEEIEFERRKPRTHFEGVCQQYEARILKVISKEDGKWHLLRVPLIMGSNEDGRASNFTGLYRLLRELTQTNAADASSNVELNYNPDSTLWMLPNDLAADLTVKLLEDNSRPSICNLVSTNVTLNQEWLHELAKHVKVASFVASEKDAFNLPSTLRNMLTDNVQVKTRNLFEVVGRYHVSPFVPTADYFAKICQYAAEQNWGQIRPVKNEQLFSSAHAQKYFEQFLPYSLDEKMKKALASFKEGLVFAITDMDECSWHLQIVAEGQVQSTRLSAPGHQAKVHFSFAAPAFMRIASGKMSFEQALVTRNLQLSGPPLQTLKACDFLRRFLRKNHFAPEGSSSSKVLEKAGKSEG